MIAFERVYKRYAGRDALAEVSLQVDQGELVFLTGHSGAGKSTLLRLIAALERPERGQIVVDGVNISKIKPRRVPYYRRQIGMIFQDHRLLADRTVFDNVALPLIIAGLRRPEILRRVRAALDLVGLLKLERAHPTGLSGGEQQRVGIARAIVGRPKVFLADEPTGNLDPELSSEIMGLFVKLSQVGMTGLIASHDLNLVRRLAQRLLVLKDGRLVDDLRRRSARDEDNPSADSQGARRGA